MRTRQARDGRQTYGSQRRLHDVTCVVQSSILLNDHGAWHPYIILIVSVSAIWGGDHELVDSSQLRRGCNWRHGASALDSRRPGGIARSGGLIDSRSNARGVFVFRFEPKAALTWPHQPVMTTAEGMVPVAFRIDLSDPASFFAIQSFPIENRDILYVSNAPITEIQKFLNVLFSVAYPTLALKQVGL